MKLPGGAVPLRQRAGARERASFRAVLRAPREDELSVDQRIALSAGKA